MKLSLIAVILIIILIAFICCLIAACGLGVAVYFLNSPTGNLNIWTPPQTGQVAPDFQLDTIYGENITLQEFRGNAVMVNFWAVWCGPCVDEMSIIQERYQQHYPDLVVLAIEEDGTSMKVRDFIADSGLSFLVLAGEESVSRRYNIHAYPTSFFIDEQGVIQSMVVGSLTGPILDAELAKIGVGE